MLARGESGIFACSALKEAYRLHCNARATCASSSSKADPATIGARLTARAHRYMPHRCCLRNSRALEEPADALVVDISDTIAAQVQHIREGLGEGVRTQVRTQSELITRVDHERV